MPIFNIDIYGLHFAPTWYGLMYAVSFIFALFLIRKQFDEKDTDLIFFFTVLGVILGGRLGYVLFYNPSYYLVNPLEILMPWKGGMSFHGGALGVILAWYLAAKKIHQPFLSLADRLVWIVPLGLFFGRIGNYINGELLGMPGYTGFLARTVDGVSYFPTPLLEAFLEGMGLFLLLYWKRGNIRYPGQLGVWFLGGYGLARFFAEFFRTPDVQIGYIYLDWLTLGHLFSIIMFIAAITLSRILRKTKR